jgi:hypothetical protein
VALNTIPPILHLLYISMFCSRCWQILHGYRTDDRIQTTCLVEDLLEIHHSSCYSCKFLIMSPKQSLVDILCLFWDVSLRCLDQTLWNLVGISYIMWSCGFKGWFFQNGCCCHGNGQNAKKKMKNTKMIIAGYSQNRNWWKMKGTTSTSSGTR